MGINCQSLNSITELYGTLSYDEYSASETALPIKSLI